jgi:hypothetical protein
MDRDQNSQANFRRTIALKFRKIERQGIADLTAPYLAVPGSDHEHFRHELDVQRRAQHDGVAGEGGKCRAVVVTQIPDFSAHQHIGGDAERKRCRTAKGRFADGITRRSPGDLRLVQQIEPRIEAVAQELDVGVDGRFELVIVHMLAAGLVDQPHIRLESERDGKRIVRRALEREIAKLSETASKRRGVAVIEIVHATDIVCRAERAKFDLDELGGRELVLIFGFGPGIVAITFAKPADAIDGKFLLALDADARAGGEAENVFGLDFLPGLGVLGARSATKAEQCECTEDSGVTPPRGNSRSHRCVSANDRDLAPLVIAHRRTRKSMAHRVISVRCEIWSLSGHSGLWRAVPRRIYGFTP